MKKSILSVALAGVLGLGLASAHVGTAVAQGSLKQKKIVFVKPGQKVVGVRPIHRHSNSGRNVAIGAAAVIGTIIAVEAARANSSGDRMSCRALENRCDDGQNWACRRLEARNDC